MRFKNLQKEFGSKYDKALFELCKKRLRVIVIEEPSGDFLISVRFFSYERDFKIKSTSKRSVLVFNHGQILIDREYTNSTENIKSCIVDFFLNGYMQARRPFIDAYNPLSDMCDYANLLLEME